MNYTNKVPYINNEDLVNYFKKNGFKKAEEEARRENIDGEILDKMEKGGWSELGINSELKKTKVQKDIKII